MYECRKCANNFDIIEVVNHKYSDGFTVPYGICPLCKSRDYVEKVCANCDQYINRQIQCTIGNKTTVPFNVACGKWDIRDLSKPKVI
ncbi:hypothetical protein LCGC14_1644430 [marine sediment metagenome]|uniref:Uncharacterized protein n=1 Tax=marine sediment metagenome TaxID=412755 RepID=A0A0F9KEK9_9ZZZZ